MTAKFTLFCCLFCCAAYAAEPTSYRFNRAIIFQDDGKQTLLAVPLDGPVYANSADDFRDVRITDQNGTDTPYLLQKTAGRKMVTKRLSSPSKTQSLEKIDDDGIVITVNLDENAASADGLTVITSQRDFEYNLQIHGSNDGENWEKLVNNSAIYDYSRYMAVKNSDITLPANGYRQFKIVIAKASQTHAAEVLELTRTLRGNEEVQRNETVDLKTQALHIDRLEFWHNQTEAMADDTQIFEYPASSFKVSQDNKHKTSLIDIDTLRQPLTGFTLHIDTPNFSRSAEVQIPVQQGIETRMQRIGSATLEALHFQDINRDQTGIGFPEQRQPHYRIVVHNQDNPPLDINKVTGTGPGYQLLFLPQNGLSYRLHYGSEKAQPPRYDTAPIQELLKRGYQTATATLSPENAVTPTEQPWDFGNLVNSRWFLGSAITLMVIVLGWSLYRVSNRLGNMPDADKPE